MKLKTRLGILLTTAFISTSMSTYCAHAVLPQFSPEQVERANAFFATEHQSWDEQKTKSFFEICFCNPENGERITEDELKNDPNRMSLLYKLFVDFDKAEFLLNRALRSYVWEYGYMQMAQEFYVPSTETRNIKLLFDEFHFEALKWHLEKLTGEELRVRINQFLDKFSSDHAGIGGINAQNGYGNTLMHDAVRFLGLGCKNGLGDREILYTFIECLSQRGFDFSLTNNVGKIAVEVAHMYGIQLPPSIIGAVPRSYSFDDFYEEAKKWVHISDESVLKANMNRFLDEYVASRVGRGGIDAKDIFGNTILHIAIPVLGTDATITSSGFMNYVGLNNPHMLEVFVECLLERKIDIEIHNYKRENAVNVAKRYGISPSLFLNRRKPSWEFPGLTPFGTISIISSKIPRGDLDTSVSSGLGSRYLFEDFRKEAEKWVSILNEDTLKEVMNQFLDKFIAKGHVDGINTRNANGNTILHEAVVFMGANVKVGNYSKGRCRCLHNPRLLIIFARCLRERGINPNIVNNNGETALELASNKNYKLYAWCIEQLRQTLLLFAH